MRSLDKIIALGYNLAPLLWARFIFGGSTLANIKSQIKRNKQNDKRRLRNRVVRGTTRAAVRDARAALAGSDAVASKEAVLAAISRLDKAAGQGAGRRPTVVLLAASAGTL